VRARRGPGTGDDRSLVIEIAGDGVGGADAARGSGPLGLEDRVDALGGHLRVIAPGGTRLRVVPLLAPGLIPEGTAA
jgi:signal transduction histidine kinase